MKKLILIIPIVFLFINAKAQGPELTVQITTGISKFVGAGTLNSTNLNVGDPASHEGYPNGTGNVGTPAYGAALQWQYVYKSDFILGLQTGFQQFNSKVNINGVYDGTGGETAATGYTINHLDFFSMNPYFGYRFNLNKVKVDVLPGLDFVFGTGSTTTTKVSASDGTYYNKSINNEGAPRSDVWLKCGLAAYYQRFGVIASYSHGMKDYNSGLLSDSVLPTLRTEIYTFGISYRIK